jgi:hypothetical protein
MVKEFHTAREPKQSPVDLAISAILDGNPNPLDVDMRDIGESPTDLDLALPGKRDNRHAAGPGHAGGRAKKASGVST